MPRWLEALLMVLLGAALDEAISLLFDRGGRKSGATKDKETKKEAPAAETQESKDIKETIQGDLKTTQETMLHAATKLESAADRIIEKLEKLDKREKQEAKEEVKEAKKGEGDKKN